MIFIFPDRFVCTRMIRRTHTRCVSYIFYVSYHSSSSTFSNTNDCYFFLPPLAAVVLVHWTRTRTCSRCFVAYPRIWSRRIFTGISFVFVQIFFCKTTIINGGILLNKHKSSSSSVTASEQSRRVAALSPRCVAVRSDAWVVVMLLHLDCFQRNK